MIADNHPGDEALLAFSQHEASPQLHKSLQRHLASCQRCRSVVQDARGLVAMINDDWTPPATDELFSRIQQSRDEGVEVVLPVAEWEPATMVPTKPVRWGYWCGLAVAAGLLITMRTIPSLSVNTDPLDKRPGPASAADETRASFDAAAAVFRAVSPLPAFAYAQSAPTHSGNSIYSGIDGSRLTPGQWRYVTTEPDAPASRYITSVKLERAAFEQRTVWRVVTSTTGRGSAGDTTLLDDFDLRPIQRRWRAGELSVRQEYGLEQPDAVLTLVTRSFATSESQTHAMDTSRIAMNAVGLLIDEPAQLALLFKLVRLHPDWQMTHGVSGGRIEATAVPGSTGRTLRVVGEDTVRVAIGAVPVWLVSYATSSDWKWHVSKSTGDLLRITGTWPNSQTRFQTDLIHDAITTKD